MFIILQQFLNKYILDFVKIIVSFIAGIMFGWHLCNAHNYATDYKDLVKQINQQQKVNVQTDTKNTTILSSYESTTNKISQGIKYEGVSSHSNDACPLSDSSLQQLNATYVITNKIKSAS